MGTDSLGLSRMPRHHLLRNLRTGQSHGAATTAAWNEAFRGRAAESWPGLWCQGAAEMATVIYGLLIKIWWWFDDRSDGWFDGELVYGDLMATWWLLDGWCSQFPDDFLLVILWYTVILWLTIYGSPSVVNLWAKWVLETLPTRHDYQVFRTVRNPNQPNKIQLLRIILFIWS